MKTLQDLVSPSWPNVTIELGTRFSLIPIKTEVVTVSAVFSGTCTHCVMNPLHPLGNAARDKHVRCGSLPLCDDKVFLPDNPESKAKYTAARLTK